MRCGRKAVEDSSFSGIYSDGSETFSCRQEKGRWIKIAYNAEGVKITYFDSDGSLTIGDHAGDYTRVEGKGTHLSRNQRGIIYHGENDKKYYSEEHRKEAGARLKSDTARFQHLRQVAIKAEKRKREQPLISKLSEVALEMLADPRLDDFTYTGNVYGRDITYTKKGKYFRQLTFTTTWPDREHTILDVNNDGIIANSEGDFYKFDDEHSKGLYNMHIQNRSFREYWDSSSNNWGKDKWGNQQTVKEKTSALFQEAVDLLTEAYEKSLGES